MDWLTVVAVAAAVASAVCAVLSKGYSRDSARAAERSAEAQLASLELEKKRQLSEYIAEGCDRLRHEGTTVHFLRSLPISKDDKEFVHQMVFLRRKHRPPKRTFQEELRAAGLEVVDAE